MRCARVIHVVNNDAAIRSVLEHRLGGQGHRVRTFPHIEAARAPGASAPDCLVIGIRRSDASGIELQECHARDGDDVPVIFIGNDCDVTIAVTAMKAGAIDFLTTPIVWEALDDALGRAFARADEWKSRRLQYAQVRSLVARLTAREMQVFTCLLAGMRNKEIAGALDSREGTVKVHRSRLMRKLESRTLAELLNIGRQLGTPASQISARARPHLFAANDGAADGSPALAPYRSRQHAKGLPRVVTGTPAQNPSV